MSTLANVGADVIFGEAANKWVGNPLRKGAKYLWKKGKGLFSGKETADGTTDKSERKGDSHHNKQTFDSMQNDIAHNKTSSSILVDQYENQIDENHPLKAQTHQPKSEGIISETEEMFRSPKMEKFSKIAPKFFDKKNDL